MKKKTLCVFETFAQKLSVPQSDLQTDHSCYRVICFAWETWGSPLRYLVWKPQSEKSHFTQVLCKNKLKKELSWCGLVDVDRVCTSSKHKRWHSKQCEINSTGNMQWRNLDMNKTDIFSRACIKPWPGHTYGTPAGQRWDPGSYIWKQRRHMHTYADQMLLSPYLNFSQTSALVWAGKKKSQTAKCIASHITTEKNLTKIWECLSHGTHISAMKEE